MFIRYSVHVYAFLYLAANPFPGFLGKPRHYPVEVEIPPHGAAEPLEHRLPLLPRAAGAPARGVDHRVRRRRERVGTGSSRARRTAVALSFSGGAVATVAFFAWFACLARGRMPQGFRDLVVWGLGYAAQVYAYLFLLTGRYPNSDPARRPARAAAARTRSGCGSTDELRRNRWTVALPPHPRDAAPHLGDAVGPRSPCSLAIPDVARDADPAAARPAPLHRFLVGLRALHRRTSSPSPTSAAARSRASSARPARTPSTSRSTGRSARTAGPSRSAGCSPSRRSRCRARSAASRCSPPSAAWFYSLVKGRMPEGLRNVIDYVARYSAQVYAYLLLRHAALPVQRPGGLRAVRLAAYTAAAIAVAVACLWGGARAVGHGRARATCELATGEALDAFSPTRRRGGRATSSASCAGCSSRRRSCSSRARDLRQRRRALRARVRRRPDRHRLPARDDGHRARLARRSCRSGSSRSGGRAATTRPRSATSSSSSATSSGLAGEALFLCLLLLVVMALARLLRSAWWAPGVAVLVGLFALLGVGEPVPRARASRRRRPRSAPTRGRSPRSRASPTCRCGSRTSTSGPSSRTPTRWGSARRGGSCCGTRCPTSFPRREVRSVVSHEFGHLQHDHIAKRIGWFALFALPAAFIVTPRHPPARRPRASPRAVPARALRARRAEPARRRR